MSVLEFEVIALVVLKMDLWHWPMEDRRGLGKQGERKSTIGWIIWMRYVPDV
jgi:hypothetical protein